MLPLQPFKTIHVFQWIQRSKEKSLAANLIIMLNIQPISTTIPARFI